MDEMVETASSTKLWPLLCTEQYNVKKWFPKMCFSNLSGCNLFNATLSISVSNETMRLLHMGSEIRLGTKRP
jgi:hypothetical protein